jgi:hypothetical protein
MVDAGSSPGMPALRAAVERLYAKQVEALADAPPLQALESGAACRADYDRFIENVARTHLRSPQLLAFLYSIAPPAATDKLLHSMLEELGIDQESRVPHPALLRTLVAGARLADRLPRLEALAQEDDS